MNTMLHAESTDHSPEIESEIPSEGDQSGRDFLRPSGHGTRLTATTGAHPTVVSADSNVR